MNLLMRGNFKASKEHVLKWYPDFGQSLEIITKYCQAAEAFLDCLPPGIRDGTITMDYFLTYMEKVFHSTFKRDKIAIAEINRVVGILRANEEKEEQAAETFTPQELLNKVKAEPSMQTDFVTWMITLSLAHIHTLTNERKGETVDASLQSGGVCPACGIKAHYGMLRGEEGYRDLACWHCGFVWTIQRLQCPYCGETEQEKMGFFETKDFKGCRIHFCHQCKNYVKVFDFREAADLKPVLMLYHLATLVMDDLAVEEGFQPGSTLCWSSALEPKEMVGYS